MPARPIIPSLVFVSMFALTGCGAARLIAQELDTYGGWREVRAEPTGWFHIETIKGRQLLVTPDGHAFVAIGVNHLGNIKSSGVNEPDLFVTRYQRSWQRFADDVLKQYADWGLNTVDDSVEPLTKARPYFAASNFVRTAKYYGKPGERNAYDFPDVFDPEVRSRLQRDVESFCDRHRDNRNLIAYYWTDTPTWDIHKTRRFRGTDWVSEIRRLPSGSPGRLNYAEFLKQRYEGDLARFHRAYELQVDTFEQLQDADFGKLDRSRYEIERDDQEYLGLIARTYYGIVGHAMRKHDPHHMVFGEMYLLGDIPPQVVQSALPHIDAVAIQPGDGYLPIYTPGDIYPSKEIDDLRKLTDKPIMICDHQISFATERYPKSIWPYYQRESEAEAADATETFIRDAFAHPYILGYMRCQYIDRFVPRRSASKLGLVKDDGTLHQLLVDSTRRANNAVTRAILAEIR